MYMWILLVVLAITQTDSSRVERQSAFPIAPSIPDPPSLIGFVAPEFQGAPPGVSGDGERRGDGDSTKRGRNRNGERNREGSGRNRNSKGERGGGDRNGEGRGEERRGGKNQNGERGTTTKATPVTGSNWVTPHLVTMSRLYNSKKERHHFHTDRPTLSQWQRGGYEKKRSPDQLISLHAFTKFEKELKRKCPGLVELKSVENKKSDTQLLFVKNRAQAQSGPGWSALESLGYCVKNKSCGATKPLRSVESTDKKNIVYTASTTEFNHLKARNPGFSKEGSEPICYVW